MAARRKAPRGARRAAAGERGFSALEVMVALAIFMTGLAGIVSVQVAAGSGLRNSADLSQATSLATSQLEALRGQSFDSLTDGSAGFDERGAEVSSDPYFTVTWVVTGSDVKDVRVTTSWSRDGDPHAVTLQSKIVR